MLRDAVPGTSSAVAHEATVMLTGIVISFSLLSSTTISKCHEPGSGGVSLKVTVVMAPTVVPLGPSSQDGGFPSIPTKTVIGKAPPLTVADADRGVLTVPLTFRVPP